MSEEKIREVELQRDEVMLELAELVHEMWREHIKKILRGVDLGESNKTAEAWMKISCMSFNECTEFRKAFYFSQAKRILEVLDKVYERQRARERLDKELEDCGLPKLKLDIPMPGARGPKDEPTRVATTDDIKEVFGKDFSDIKLPSERWAEGLQEKIRKREEEERKDHVEQEEKRVR